MKRTFAIDGTRFSTLEGFYDDVGRVLVPDCAWGRNLDAFDDILGGGFGTPAEGFVIRWENSQASREKLGYPETVRQLQSRLENCHPSNREAVSANLKDAENGIGPTVFDWLVEIIQDHGAGGAQSDDGIELELV